MDYKTRPLSEVSHEFYRFACIDCSNVLDYPSHRIPTNNGYEWICTECREKIKCKYE